MEMKYDWLISIKKGLVYGAPSSGAAKFATVVTAALWPKIEGVVAVVNEFGILEMFGLTITLDQKWIQMVIATCAAAVAASIINWGKFTFKKYVGTK